MPARSAVWSVWRPVLIPAEHGGWGFLLEPVLLGFLVAPSWAALLLALSTTAAFLLRNPLKLLLIGRRRPVKTPRTRRARQALLVLVVIAGGCFLGALRLAGPAFMVPLAMTIPVSAFYLAYDMTKSGRNIQAELTGPLALAAVASSMAVMDGWPLPTSLVLWAALGLRSVPSVLYVRARIRLDRGRSSGIILPIAAHMLALAAVCVLVWAGLLPVAAILPFTLLLARAIWFLGPQRPMVPLKTIRFTELGLGILLVVSLAVGFAT